MRKHVLFNNQRYELKINNDKGIMLVSDLRSQTYYMNCSENETPELLFNRFYDLYGDKINA